MIRRVSFFALISFICLGAFVQAKAQLPPIIDRELIFGNPEIAGAQISPDGKFIAFVKPLNDVRNVWVKTKDEPFSAARPLTNEKKRPIGGFFWSQDSKRILFVKDNDGDENFNVYAVNPADSPASGSEVPNSINLTNAKNVQTQIYAVPKTDPDTIYIGINDRDPAWHDLYKVSISSGQKTLLRKNEDRLAGWIFDNKDQLRLALRTPPNGDTEVLKVDGDKFTKVYSCNVFEVCSPIRFHKDNRRVYMETNKGDRDLSQLVLFDPETGKEEFVEGDPMKRVDFGTASFSDLSNELTATTYTDEKNRIYWKDKSLKKDYDRIRKNLGNTRELNFDSTTTDENIWLITSYSDTDPGTKWMFDRRTKNLTTLYKSREKLPRESLAPMTPVRYKSSDGFEIPAYLTLPKGIAAKNLPALIVPHGGPWARDNWGYNAVAQFFANRGYAVLSPNFRGSTGYGKKFIDAGNKQWGDKMQDDLTWGVKYLVEQGIADPKRVGIFGGSYGGYATLAGVTFTPDTYTAAVAYVAPSNLITLLNSIPPYWEGFKKVFFERMGDPSTPEGKAQLERQSPLTHADKIKTPLMIVQGANDPRVKKAEADQIVVALRDRKYPVEYLLAPDEGHGFARPVNNMALYASMEKFFAKYLGGRYQESMTPEVTKRLSEITVDVKTVSMPVKNEPVSMDAKPSVDVTGKWEILADAGGQMIPITLELKQIGADLSGSMSSHLGTGTMESGKISGNSLVGTVKFSLQGQQLELKMDGKVEGDKMSGSIEAPGIPMLSFSGTRAK